MVSRSLSIFVGVLCVILLPAVFADYCTDYVDSNGYYHDQQNCGSYYCCGNCYQMACCKDRTYRISSDEQRLCGGGGGGGGGGSNSKKSKLATLLGSILGSILPVLLCVGLAICCLAPCCFLYKKCRKGRGRGPAVIHVPQQPHHPGQPSGPGYNPVPVQPGFGGGPSGPPPYFDGNPGAFSPGQPMYPLPNPQPPYNPAYNPNH
ncbi:protein shisa-4-like [Xyrichtys novacula]|uniref:Protein shisa-4-like n=1 Tax=Xyrichtys novacula TaxID=13765 RepID=A0AAV1EP49_XYRNO|nr:protein shisa-4-like [Xyrichtys novacula]